jgi:hypothetical protein
VILHSKEGLVSVVVEAVLNEQQKKERGIASQNVQNIL